MTRIIDLINIIKNTDFCCPMCLTKWTKMIEKSTKFERSASLNSRGSFATSGDSTSCRNCYSFGYNSPYPSSLYLNWKWRNKIDECLAKIECFPGHSQLFIFGSEKGKMYKMLNNNIDLDIVARLIKPVGQKKIVSIMDQIILLA